MDERLKSFFVGVFIIGALVIIAWLFLFLRPSVGDGEKKLRVRFANIEKIALGTRVTFAGKPVGEVVEINEIFDARNQPTDAEGNIYFYELVLKVDSSVKIYSYDEIIFSSSGLLGERSISIIPRLPPAGKPPGCEITTDILYARSSDPLTDTLNQIKDVAVNFEETLDKVESLIDENKEQFHHALCTFTSASEQVKTLASRANEMDLVGKVSNAAVDLRSAMGKADVVLEQTLKNDLIPRMSVAFDKAGVTFKNLQKVTEQLTKSESSLGRLINSDQFYLQMSGTMSRIQSTLNDVNQYGLLFQYDKRWQRQKLYQQQKLQRLCQPGDFYAFFNEELQKISVSVDQVSDAMITAECCDVKLEDPCFSEQFRLLLQKVEELQKNLNLYQQNLSQEYYQKCYCQ